jgi:hypothetical protein
MIDGVAAFIYRIGQDGGEFAGKDVGEDPLALDKTGIAVTRFFSCPPPVYENDIAAALLKM